MTLSMANLSYSMHTLNVNLCIIKLNCVLTPQIVLGIVFSPQVLLSNPFYVSVHAQLHLVAKIRIYRHSLW